uniref:Movement protein n=1 Tax=Tobacco yellow dwarf virus TaxID=10830 RepID=Q6T332_9GEMI|nr:putative movement protein [Tobacco yellow dwarf virus]
MYPAKYQVFPSGINYSDTPVGTFEQYQPQKAGESSEHFFSKVVVALIVILFAVGIVYLAYTLFLKDLILLLKAKEQKTTTEIGFGNTPLRRPGEGNPNGGPV